VSVFGLYAKYYDLLYRDKDYAGEAAAVARLIRAHDPAARRVFELGCGTGGHAVALARAGYEVTGIDLSEPMLERAQARRAREDAPVQGRLRFLRMDARHARLGERYDAAAALFHVLSYQASDADLAATLASAAAHLRPGAPFVFDFWYGPAVLAQRPETRMKRMADDDIEVERSARPTLREAAQCVEVAYDVLIRDRRSGEAAPPLAETHVMRYFFLEPLQAALARAGLRFASAADLQTGAPPSEKTWSVCAVALAN
jgi:SAM-dependent methyltransferase